MKNFLHYSLLLSIGIFSFWSCKSEPSPAQKQKTELQESADKFIESSKELSQHLGDNVEGKMGEAMKELEEGMNKLKKENDIKDPVNFRKLKEVFPQSAAGFERSNSRGNTTGAMGIKVSQVEAEYTNENQRVEATLVDAGGLGNMLMGMAFWSELQIDEESDDGFKRTLTLNGHQAYQECSNNNKNCKLSLIVDQRFILDLESQNVNMDKLMQLMESLDLENLKQLD